MKQAYAVWDREPQLPGDVTEEKSPPAVLKEAKHVSRNEGSYS